MAVIYGRRGYNCTARRSAGDSLVVGNFRIRNGMIIYFRRDMKLKKKKMMKIGAVNFQGGGGRRQNTGGGGEYSKAKKGCDFMVGWKWEGNDRDIE